MIGRLLVTLGVCLLSVCAVAADIPERLKYCVTCHGVDGQGNRTVMAPRLAGMEPWYLERQLAYFAQGYRGYHPDDLNGKEMRPMAANLSEADVKLVLKWIATWPTESAPAKTVTGDVAKGKTLYLMCAACHGEKAEGQEMTGAPALAGQSDWYLVEQLRKYKAGERGTHLADHFGRQMKPMADVLVDEQAMRDVVTYIQTL